MSDRRFDLGFSARGRFVLLTISGVVLLLSGCGSSDGGPPPILPAPIAVASVVSSIQDPLAAVSSVQFDGSRSTSAAPGGITAYRWDFGDGTQANGALVQHVFNTSGTKTVTLTVSDANGNSPPASTTVAIKDLTGTWRAQFNVQTRTYTLVQNGTVITGTYTNNYLAGQIWTTTGSIDASRRLTITSTYPDQITVVLSSALVDNTASSFTGVTHGGSADNVTLTYVRDR